MKMKNLYSLVIVALMVAPGLRADNLTSNSGSSISPRIQSGGMLLVDGTLMYVLNKLTSGADTKAIEAAKARLQVARENFAAANNEHIQAAQKAKNLSYGKNLAQNNGTNLQKLAREYDMQSEVGRKGRYGHGSKAARKVGNHGLKNTMQPERFDANSALKNLVTEADIAEAELLAKQGITVTAEEIAAANKAANELMAARNEAAKVVSELSKDASKLEAAGLKADKTAKGWRVIRWLGNVGLALDMAGQGWAFYDNSSTPLFMGGISKLTQEGHDALYSKLEEHVAPKETREEEKARIEAMPRRGTLAPQGPATHGETVPAGTTPFTGPTESRPEAVPIIEAPVNQLPPLLKEKPEFKRKKVEVKPMM